MRTRAFFLAALPLVFCACASVRADVAPAPGPVGGELVSNGDFAAALNDPSWPDGWRKPPGITWENESRTHYLRFVVAQPGKATSLFQSVPLPSSETIKALRVSVRYRIKNLKAGAGPTQDARMTFRFYDCVKIAFSPEPAPLIFPADTGNWKTITTTFQVPAHAVLLEFFIGLYQVESGALEVADISIKPTPEAGISAPVADNGPAAVASSASAQADAQVPVVRDGLHTIIGYGKPSVWFIHPYVDVLGHDFVQGITHLVLELKEKGYPVAVGVSENLDPGTLQDEPDAIYVFTYKNINYALPADARRLMFVNTWLTPSVTWPASRAAKKDVVIIGSRMLNNNGDGLATNKARWMQIQKDDPALSLTVLDSTGYYLPIKAWREPILKVVLEEKSGGK